MSSLTNKKDDSEEEKVVAEQAIAASDGPRLARAKSEKKRNREQQRRNALNEGLDRLTELLFFVDPHLKTAAEERTAKNNKTSNNEQLLSRVELVNSAVSTLGRIHQENERNKQAAALIMSSRGMPTGIPPVGMNFAHHQSLGNKESTSQAATDSASLPGLGSPPRGAASLVRPPPFATAGLPFGGQNIFSPYLMGHPLLPQAYPGGSTQPNLQCGGSTVDANQPAAAAAAHASLPRTGMNSSVMESTGHATVEKVAVRFREGATKPNDETKEDGTPKKRRKKN